MRLTVLIALFLALVPAAYAGSVTFQGDSARTGNVAVDGLAPPLTTAWTATLRGTVSAPVVVGDTVYVTQPSPPESDLYTTGPNVELLALDAATGAERWKRTISARLGQGNLSVIGGRLIVTDDFGQVSAFGLDGTPAWTFKISANSALIAADLNGNVVVPDGAGYSPLIAIGGDGTERWRSNAYGDAAPSVAGGRVFEGLQCGAINAFEADGAVAWANPGTCSGPGSPTAISDGRIWVPDTNGNGAVLDTATGTRLRDYSGASAPSFGAGLAIFWQGDSRNPQAVRAVDAATGTTTWEWTPPDQIEFATRLGPFIVGDTVYVTVNGRLWARDLRTGDARQDLAIPDQVDRSHTYGGMPGIAAGHGLLLVPTRGSLIALRSSGTAATPTPAGSTDASSPNAPPEPTTSPAARRRLVIHAPDHITRRRLKQRGVRIRIELPSGVSRATVRLVRRQRTLVTRTVMGKAVRVRVARRHLGRRLRVVVSAPGVPTVRQPLRVGASRIA